MQASSMLSMLASAGPVKVCSFNGCRGSPFALTTPSTSFTVRSRSLRFWITVRRERSWMSFAFSIRFSCVTR